MAYEYYYGRESEKFMFYRIPKLLFKIDEFRELSIEARVLYGMLLDRVGLSAENGWIDEKGRVFIIYTVADAAKSLGCSVKKSVGIIKELEEIGLVEKKRRGMGKPNLIYVKNFLTELSELQLKNCKKYNSGIVNPSIQELSYVQPINTKENDTEFNNTENEQSLQVRQDGSDERELYHEIVMDDIGYDELLRKHPSREGLIRTIVDVITDIMVEKDDRILLGKEEKSVQAVRGMYSKLRFEHIEYVISSYRQFEGRIKNVRGYLLSALYYAPIAMK